MTASSTWQAPLGCLLILMTVSVPAQGQPVQDRSRAEELIDGLRSRIETASAIRADFTQTFSSEFFDDTESASGQVTLQGRKYRVETSSQVFVSDGVTTWIHDTTADQVLINDYVEDETTVSLNRFLLSSKEDYRTVGVTAVDVAGIAHTAVHLESTDTESFFPQCTVLFRSSDDELAGLTVVDLNGTTIRFDLRNVSYGPVPPALTFTFDPSVASDVVDLRSS